MIDLIIDILKVYKQDLDTLLSRNEAKRRTLCQSEEPRRSNAQGHRPGDARYRNPVRIDGAHTGGEHVDDRLIRENPPGLNNRYYPLQDMAAGSNTASYWLQLAEPVSSGSQ